MLRQMLGVHRSNDVSSMETIFLPWIPGSSLPALCSQRKVVFPKLSELGAKSEFVAHEFICIQGNNVESRGSFLGAHFAEKLRKRGSPCKQDVDLQLKILAFMLHNENSNVFPGAEELLRAGRVSLVEARGGWLGGERVALLNASRSYDLQLLTSSSEFISWGQEQKARRLQIVSASSVGNRVLEYRTHVSRSNSEEKDRSESASEENNAFKNGRKIEGNTAASSSLNHARKGQRNKFPGVACGFEPWDFGSLAAFIEYPKKLLESVRRQAGLCSTLSLRKKRLGPRVERKQSEACEKICQAASKLRREECNRTRGGNVKNEVGTLSPVGLENGILADPELKGEPSEAIDGETSGVSREETAAKTALEQESRAVESTDFQSVPSLAERTFLNSQTIEILETTEEVKENDRTGDYATMAEIDVTYLGGAPVPESPSYDWETVEVVEETGAMDEVSKATGESLTMVDDDVTLAGHTSLTESLPSDLKSTMETMEIKLFEEHSEETQESPSKDRDVGFDDDTSISTRSFSDTQKDEVEATPAVEGVKFLNGTQGPDLGAKGNGFIAEDTHVGGNQSPVLTKSGEPSKSAEISIASEDKSKKRRKKKREKVKKLKSEDTCKTPEKLSETLDWINQVVQERENWLLEMKSTAPPSHVSTSIEDRIQDLQDRLSAACSALRSGRNADSGALLSDEHTRRLAEIRDASDELEFTENKILKLSTELTTTLREVSALETAHRGQITDSQTSAGVSDPSKQSAQASLRAARVVWSHPAREVFLIGSFNDWKDKIKMELSGAGVFVVSVLLPPGSHEIKFIVDGTWRVDIERPIVYVGGYENNVIDIPEQFTLDKRKQDSNRT